MPNGYLNAARAALGQGLGMGWGDEAEAWLRSKLGQGSYEDQVRQIRNEYARYAQENPVTSGALELGGGFIPGAVAMMVPGAQPVGAAALARTGTQALGRLAALGATTGAVSGAGSAEEGSRGAGAVGGALAGGVAGAAIPIALRGAGAGSRWLAERLLPSDNRATSRAAQLLNESVARSKMTPADVATRMAEDRRLGVPSMVANVSPETAKRTRGIVKRAGAGAQEIEDALVDQRLGSRERTYSQVNKNLQPGDYYKDEQGLVDSLRQRASNMYDAAYSHGAVDDPRINTVLQHPEFASFFNKAQAIAKSEAMAAKLRGEDPSKYELQDLYKLVLDPQTQALTPVVTRLPDVRTLDYMKRGIDATIDSGFRGQGMSTAEAQALKQLRREFVNAIDENVPAYQQARKAYAGDLEVIDAMRLGMSDFGKLDHEQISKMVAGMSQAEKEALRTGVARNLYGTIMRPSTNQNSAQRLIGSPEMQAKLQPLFDNPAQFDLFKAALERESQLFNHASRVLGGSDTAENLALREQLDKSGEGFGTFLANSITGGFGNSLTNLTLGVVGKTALSDKSAKRLSEMLLAKDPHEVAAVVKLLEEQAAKAAPKAFRAGVAEAGTATGVISSGWPAPLEKSDVQTEQQPSFSE